MKRVFHKVEQNSDEWFELRKCRYTSSNFGAIMAYHDSPQPKWGKTAEKYARKKALEIVTGKLEDIEGYSNKLMERGHKLEPIAIELYEQKTMFTVEDGGFTSLGERFGDSPDGLVGATGCIEVKSVVPETHWPRIQFGGYDKSYQWQIAGHMFVSNRAWCDFIQFCPQFPEKHQLYIHRVERDAEMEQKLIVRLGQFENLVQHYIKMIS